MSSLSPLLLSRAPKSLIVRCLSDNVLSVCLNRPKAFNALDMEQCDYLLNLYSEIHDRAGEGGTVVVMEGADTGKSTKAFCAGGDVRQIYDQGLTEPQGSLCRDFFFREYILNSMISKHSGQVSIWDGIVMGGGVGLSVHGSHRVSTSRTVFAMPETGIGFFPDVGASAVLPFLDGGWGYYLALTGEAIDGRTARRIGLSTAHCHDFDEAVRDELMGRLKAGHDLQSVIDDIDEGATEAKGAVDDVIEECFHSKSTLEELLGALEGCKGQEAERIRKVIKAKSPTSVAVAFEQLKRGEALKGDIDDCLRMEYDICQNMIKQPGGDFYEGVRAALVDKDKNPSWRQFDGQVQMYFERDEGNAWNPTFPYKSE